MSGKVFISYASEDREIAGHIESRLNALGLRVSIDYRAIDLSDNIEQRIREELAQCSILVVIVSPASLKSPWVPFEVGLATGKIPPVKLIPFLVHPSMDLPDFLRSFRHATSVDELCEFLVKCASAVEEGPHSREAEHGAVISPESKVARHMRILIAGQACWDEIVWPSGHSEEWIGGSVYYVTKAIQYMAEIMQYPIEIDVWAAVGSDLIHRIAPRFEGTLIKTYFVAQEKTLRFRNHYRSERDWTRRDQQVLQVPDNGLCSAKAPEAIQRGANVKPLAFILLLTLTPYDFVNIAEDIVPFLWRSWPGVPIGLELQGLLRDVPREGGSVGRRLSEDLIALLKKRAIYFAHANIDEALFLVKELARRSGITCALEESSPAEIALELCSHGVRYVGLTDGGRGSWIAWQSDDGKLHSQHSPTADITRNVKTPHATGAGDTWFGVFAYALFGRGFDPISAALLATQFATLKCTQKGALGERVP